MEEQMEKNRSTSLRYVVGHWASFAAGASLLLGLTFYGPGATGATAAGQGTGDGARPIVQKCGTANVSELEMVEAEREVKARRGDKASGAERAAVSHVISVYFHVITTSTGEGAVSDGGIGRQMRALNGGFVGTGFSFVL